MIRTTLGNRKRKADRHQRGSAPLHCAACAGPTVLAVIATMPVNAQNAGVNQESPARRASKLACSLSGYADQRIQIPRSRY